MFSGSYLSEDVTFLLKVIDLPPLDISEKERLIQCGERHYSEMISREIPPSPTYLALFHEAFRDNRERLAEDLLKLARAIDEKRRGDITIVSLARAGTPIGVLLTRILRRLFRRETHHYSVSIIRDRGVDEVALRHILEEDGRSPESVVFIDGWTGKGVIARELDRFILAFNRRHRVSLDPRLYVVADIAGVSGVAATGADYLIPSSILNAVVSGLVSRSILNDLYIGEGDFHGCLYYEEFAPMDLSRWFVDTMADEVIRCFEDDDKVINVCLSEAEKERLRLENRSFLDQCAQECGMENPNHIKVGIGETTRVLLRRVPEKILLRNRGDNCVRHLVHLAREKCVPVEEAPWLPYMAAAFIRSVKTF